MRIIVIGAGMVGYNIVQVLARERHELVVIDLVEENLARAGSEFDLMTICGNGANPAILRQAGAERADLLVAATVADEVNMIACFMAKQMGTHRTVARICQDEYIAPLIVDTFTPMTAKRVVRPKTLGIDFVITPETVTAEEIVSILRNAGTIAVKEFGDGQVGMVAYKAEGAWLDNRPLREVVFPCPCSVAAIIRGKETIIPDESTMVQHGDHIYVIGPKEAMVELGPFFGKGERPVRSVMILGGGKIGFRVAQQLAQAGIKVKVIEKELARCREIAAALEGVRVVHGEGRTSSFLIEEGVAEADGFVATTGSDSLNILVSLLADRLGAHRVVVLVNQAEYVPLATSLGIDVAVSPLLLTAGAILRFVHRGHILSVVMLEGEAAEAIELMVEPTSRVVGRRLRELGLPKDALIGALIRQKKAIIPKGDTVIEAEDRIVAVGTPSSISAIERSFSKA